MMPSDLRVDQPTTGAPPWVAGVAVLLAVVAAYLPALRAGFIWDDDDYVTANETLRSPDGLRRIWFEIGATPQYYPLVHTTFWIEYRLWGLNPLGYHTVNVVLHGLSAVLLGLLLRRLRVPGAWLAAALFGLHPVHVESVAWITERKNVLSAACYLGSLLAYRRFSRLGDADGPRDWGLYGLALLLFALALFAKTVTCTLPAAILLLTWWKRGRLTWRDIAPTLPLFVSGIALAALTIWMEAHLVGAARVAWGLSGLDRILIAGRAVWFYLGKLVWPHPLCFVYPRWTIDPAQPAACLYPVAAVGLVAVLVSARRRLGRGPLVAALFFGGTLVPALGFVNVYPMRYSFVADHFQYLASIGPLTLLAALTARGLEVEGRLPGGPRLGRSFALPRRATAALCLIVLGLLGALTWRQAGWYRDAETLWRHTLAVNPGAWMAHNNLGDLLLCRGHVDEAAMHFAAAVRLAPDDAYAHNNLAITLHRQGCREEALSSFREALRRRPDYPEAHSNLAAVLLELGRYDEALQHLDAALRLRPDRAEAHVRRGDVYAAVGRRDDAIAAYRRALQIRPDLVEAHHNLGAVLLEAGRVAEAIAQFEHVLRSEPGLATAHNNLGHALIKAGQPEAAARRFRTATELDPSSASAWSNLGGALRGLGDDDQAIEAYRRALILRPNDADLHLLLGEALTAVGRGDEAVEAYRAALRIDPRHERARRALNAAAPPRE
ncbi:MAG: tetratricopeptide repeat protein [Planctomycetota bacterium]